VFFDGCLLVNDLTTGGRELVLRGIYQNAQTGAIGNFELGTQQLAQDAPGGDAQASETDREAQQTAWYEALRANANAGWSEALESGPSTADANGRSRRRSLGVLIDTFGFRAVISCLFVMIAVVLIAVVCLLYSIFAQLYGLGRDGPMD